MRRDAPLVVEVPTADRDKPGWVKVGVIAAVGFGLGIAWPRAVGVRLGPSAPGDSASVTAVASATPAGSDEALSPPASVTAKAEAPAAPSSAEAKSTAPPVTSSPPKISVTKGTILNCRTREGDRRTGKDCGTSSGIDDAVIPRIKKVTTCTGALGQSGRFTVLAEPDFKTGRLSYELGRRHTVQNVAAIAACLDTAFRKASVTADVPHEHARYKVSYTAVLSTDGDVPPSAGAKEDGAGEREKKAKTEPPVADAAPAKPSRSAGEAEVAWEVALIRDTPKVGSVVARLPRGNKVKVGASKEGWYEVKFGDDFARSGWVYRGAIGR